MGQCRRLGEAVSWPRLLAGDEDYVSKMAVAQRVGKVVEGHTPGARGVKLQAYVAAGVNSCHESISLEEVLERLVADVKMASDREGAR